MNRLFLLTVACLAILALIPCASFTYEREIKNLSSTMAENIFKTGKKTIAVVDFVDLRGNVNELGRFMAEEFSVALAGAKKGFKIVERTHLKTILEEHKLTSTGLIDPATAKKLGQITGVDALVTGTITPFGDSVRLAVKILDTATGDVIDAVSGDIAKTKAIEELLGKSIDTGIAESKTPSETLAGVKGGDVEGFGFKPLKCRRDGNKMICTVSFQNNGSEERTLKVWGQTAFTNTPYSNLYDNQGNQYPVVVQIGKKKSSDVPLSTQPVVEKFIPQLPVNVNFLAESVHPEATHISVVIGIEGFKKSVTIKNIPITK